MPIDSNLRSGGPSSFFLRGRRGKGFFPLPVHQILRFPEKKDVRSQVTANCEPQLQYRTSLQEEEGMFVFTLRRGISDFGITQGINRVRDNAFVILGIERKEQCYSLKNAVRLLQCGPLWRHKKAAP